MLWEIYVFPCMLCEIQLVCTFSGTWLADNFVNFR